MTYGELFAGMSGDRVQLALADMKEMISNERPKWTWLRPFEERPLRRTFDFRAARAKAFAFRLAAIQDEMCGNRQGSQILADAGRKGLIQILPWSRQKREVFSSPGNRFLVLPAEVTSLRELVVRGVLSHELCAMHVISDEALHFLQTEDFDRFVSPRLNDIEMLEHEFVGPFVEAFEPGYLYRYDHD
jgi:hypothetical protein